MKVEYIILSKLIRQWDFPCFVSAENKKVAIKKCGKAESVDQKNKEIKWIVEGRFCLFMHCSLYKG